MTAFLTLAKLLESIKAESSRNKKISMIADFLKELEEDEIYPATLFIAGQIIPESESKKSQYILERN